MLPSDRMLDLGDEEDEGVSMRESEYLREGDGTSTIIGAGKPKRKRGAEQSSMYSHSVPPNPDYDEDEDDEMEEDVGDEDGNDEYGEENP